MSRNTSVSEPHLLDALILLLLLLLALCLLMYTRLYTVYTLVDASTGSAAVNSVQCIL
jgi:hypothetical protein